MKVNMVGIEVRGGKIRIGYQYRGKKCWFNPCLDASKKQNFAAASQIRKSILNEIANRTFDPCKYGLGEETGGKVKNAPLSFGELADQYLTLIKPEIAPGTYQKYVQGVNHWKALFVGEDLQNLTYLHLRVLVAKLTWSAKNKNNHLSILRGIFQLGIEASYLDDNPAKRIRNARVQKPAPDPLEPAEVEKVLAYMEKHYPKPVVNYFQAMFFGGFRPEEAISLRIADVRLDQDGSPISIHVSRATTNGIERATKTYTARDVMLSRQLAAVIASQVMESQSLGIEHLFFNPNTKKPWSSEKFQRVLYWYPSIAALGIRKRVCYQTRHTYASISLSAGANPLWLAKQMGHSSTKMLFERYAKWIDQGTGSKEHLKIEEMFKK